MTKKQRALAVIERLKEKYPDAICSLTYRKDYELLIATRLSAQCTDARVNIVTKDLFAQFPTVESFAQADLSQVEEIVKPCGLYILVREYRCSGGTETASPVEGNR